MTTKQKQRKKTISECPKCGAEIQATVKIYLSKVELKDGQILRYKSGLPNSDAETIENIVQSADEVDIYCDNDHALSIDGELEGDDDDDDQ
jgi:DNA-directed RNA polymerase subunit M/transcription elongation factor TFIIS